MKNKEAKLVIAGIATGIALSFTGCTTEIKDTLDFVPADEREVAAYGVVEDDSTNESGVHGYN